MGSIHTFWNGCGAEFTKGHCLQKQHDKNCHDVQINHFAHNDSHVEENIKVLYYVVEELFGERSRRVTSFKLKRGLFFMPFLVKIVFFGVLKASVAKIQF